MSQVSPAIGVCPQQTGRSQGQPWPQVPLSRSISNGSDEYGRPRKGSGRVEPGTSGTLEGSISALADALSSLDSGVSTDKARRLDFGALHQVRLPCCTAPCCTLKHAQGHLIGLSPFPVQLPNLGTGSCQNSQIHLLSQQQLL